MESKFAAISANSGANDEAMSTLDNLPQRIRDIATLRGLGYTFKKIGHVFDVTPQAVSLMLSRHRRCLHDLRSKPDLAGLSPRAVNALHRHAISTRTDAARKNALELLKGERNCGRKTLDEIERWLGVSSPTRDAVVSASHAERRTRATDASPITHPPAVPVFT